MVGSHGKTSVAGRIAWALNRLNFPISYLVGAQFRDTGIPSGSLKILHGFFWKLTKVMALSTDFPRRSLLP